MLLFMLNALFINFFIIQQLKMVLIKCCDISNEVRPMEVSEPWVDCLLEEYFNQVNSRVDKRHPCPLQVTGSKTINRSTNMTNLCFYNVMSIEYYNYMIIYLFFLPLVVIFFC